MTTQEPDDDCCETRIIDVENRRRRPGGTQRPSSSTAIAPKVKEVLLGRPTITTQEPDNDRGETPDSEGEQATRSVLVEHLRDQLKDARERIRSMQEQQNRLMALLVTEQVARAALEQRLLPAPAPAPNRTPPASRVGLWTLAIVLLAALALAGWHFREGILATLGL